ncbi:porphyrin biosynthetic protein [Acinetobacter baumannii ABNIH22]|uniref:VWFA domain-containing protein n=4 Tax=Acinetobacter baumannii TaxID=470 RepID=A0AAP1ADQ7_ACIBA|nr:hypothetical protein [Acinetobacter baumannii]EMT94620.1 porphyrin biosynthetic protein [Acinetobacter baumannii ABNIH5]EXD24120.1 von Willebrand factor type A domain protein [Acinetobacter baumannii 34654]EYU47100.1 von Willebrand factor type A domain protein [Acinetobacter baumannii 1457504]KCX90287.1 von Willebrand factor type A domain protein [Acinetobacter baumannii 15827]EGT88684.1 hypothetical protein ABNIH1_19430 [Acinetobacter baumannii ABNIH1]
MNNRIANLRNAIVAITNALIEKKIEVTQIGMEAYVKSDINGNPISINLPYLSDNASEELIRAIQGFLDHEVAHVLFSDFKALNSVGDYLLKSLANILEDARIEKCMAEKFRGSGSNLDHTAHFFLEEMITPKFKEVMAHPDVDETKIMGILATPYLRSLSGQSTFEIYMRDKIHLLPNIHAAIKHLAPQLQSMQSSQDAVRLAKEIYKALKSPEDEKQPPQDQQQEEECDQQGNGQSNEDEDEQPGGSGGGNSDEDEGSDADGQQGAGEGDDGDSEEDGAGESSGDADEQDEQGDGGKGGQSEDEDGGNESDGKSERHQNKSDKSNGKGDSNEGNESSDSENQTSEKKKELRKLNLDAKAILQEIDKESANDFDASFAVQLSNEAKDFACTAPYLVYTNRYDVIETLKIGRNYKSSFMDDLDRATNKITGTIQKDLERLMVARSARTWENGLRQGKINQASLSRLAVRDDRIFRRKQENRSKDVAVTLLIDCSGSMKGERINTASQASYAMSSVLDRLNINHEVIGFTTKNGDPHAKESFTHNGKTIRYTRTEGLYMPVIKGFNERLTLENRHRFAWLPHVRFLNTNVDGECLQIAAQRLSAQKEARKIIMVLSDGNPNGSGPTPTLNKHLKTTVQEISRSGFEVIGIGINTQSVKEFYPKNVVLRSVADLPNTVIGELRSLLLK